MDAASAKFHPEREKRFESEFRRKEVRTNLHKTRMLLGVSLALSIAGSTAAAERTRGAANDDQIRSSNAVAVAQPTIENIEMVAPGVGQAEINGITVQARTDGAIVLADILAEHDSLQAYQMAMQLSSVAIAPGPAGEVIAANGMVYYDRDFLGGNAPDNMPIRSADEYKSRMAYATSTQNGIEVLVFADGVIVPDQVAASPQALGNTPTIIGPGGQVIAANGAIAFE